MILEPRCSVRKCKHLLGTKSEGVEENERPICAAFPDGIPREIAYGPELHLEPFEGDHGIQYERETEDDSPD